MGQVLSLSLHDPGVQASLQALADRLGPQKAEILDGIGAALAENVRLSISDGRDPYGRPWEPLRMRAGRPLLDTGTHLRANITHAVSGDTIEVGTTFAYAHVHQFGATIRPKRARMLVFTPRGFGHPIFAKKVTIPARPFLPEGRLPDAWAEEIKAQVEEAVSGAR